jgi:hypothetical protein
MSRFWIITAVVALDELLVLLELLDIMELLELELLAADISSAR